MEGLREKRASGETKRRTGFKLPFDVARKRIHFPRHLSPFWRFQLIGWAAFSVFSFPLKWVLLESIPGAILVSLYRDGLGFFLTTGMREIYRRIYTANLPPSLVAAIVGAVSLAGGGVLTLFSVAFHSALDFEEGKIFTTAVVFGIFYFRTGLCLGWSLLYFGFKLVRDHAEHRMQLACAERDLAKAETHLLRAQMDPHFLYNALNTVLSGIGKSDEHLRALVRSLSQYLRFSLETRDQEFVPLGREFDAIAGYLAVEKARFREKLEIECHINSGAREALVPGILIQPLVENAMKYGKRTSARPLRIRLLISSLPEERVSIEVANSGRWVEPDPADTVGGIGLENLKERLGLLYPDSHDFRISEDSGWVTVQIILTSAR
ncbi:MAG TPA: histidine kinase [Terrimicrobiaceae bacterium]|nr:histidine kinase [Terrimicrobiaceae bacterium]